MISYSSRSEIKPSKLSGPSVQAQLGLIGAQFSLLSGTSLLLCAWLGFVECIGLVLGLSSTELNQAASLLVLSRTYLVL